MGIYGTTESSCSPQKIAHALPGAERQCVGPGGGGGARLDISFCSHSNCTVLHGLQVNDLAKGTTVKMLMSSEEHAVEEGLTIFTPRDYVSGGLGPPLPPDSLPLACAALISQH